MNSLGLLAGFALLSCVPIDPAVCRTYEVRVPDSYQPIAVVSFENIHTRFHYLDTVEITEGFYKGQRAEIKGYNGKYRVSLWSTGLIITDVPADALQAVTDPVPTPAPCSCTPQLDSVAT